MFVVFGIVALLLGVWGRLRHWYYVQLREVYAAFAEHPELEIVRLVTNDDVELEVEQVYFIEKGHPENVYFTYGPDELERGEFRAELEKALREKRAAPK
jgi:hypothetical protein